MYPMLRYCSSQRELSFGGLPVQTGGQQPLQAAFIQCRPPGILFPIQSLFTDSNPILFRSTIFAMYVKALVCSYLRRYCCQGDNGCTRTRRSVVT